LSTLNDLCLCRCLCVVASSQVPANPPPQCQEPESPCATPPLLSFPVPLSHRIFFLRTKKKRPKFLKKTEKRTPAMRCYLLYPLSCDILPFPCLIFFLLRSFLFAAQWVTASSPDAQQLKRTSTQSGAKRCGAGGLGWGNPASFSTRSFTNAETLPSRAL
jgi:hypothetical protein